MDIDAKLVFSAPHDGTGRLVFGDTGGAEVVPEAVFSVDADLPGLGTLTLHAGAMLGLDADLPGLDGTVGLEWIANVSRGGLRCEVQTGWQQAQPVAHALGAVWRESAPVRGAAFVRWQEGVHVQAGLVAGWQATDPLRSAAAVHWQNGNPVRAALDPHWQEAVRHRAVNAPRWQDAAPVRATLDSHWQDLRRLRALADTHWQEGARLRTVAGARWSYGRPRRIDLRTHWQEAMRPHSGVSPRPKPPEPKPPCYDPATIGRLIFTDPAAGDGRLVFVCQRGAVLPPAGVVVLPRRTYIMINSIEIRRADALAGDPLPSESFQMALNRSSWTWTFSAAFHASARDAVAPGSGGQPVELEVRVNGQPFRMQAERIGRSKRFPEHMVTASGRGRAAVLDPQHAAVQTFGQTLDRTAHHLMTEVLTINGVGFGWSVDWQLTDWLVPGGAWMHQGSRASALAEIAASVGGYLQPHDTDPVLHVLPGWPKPWWEWATLAPDIELPAGIAEVEDTEIIDLPGYNRIFVSGDGRGISADLTRDGTAGDVLKQPMAVHPLITSIGAAKQRALAELAESGRMIKHKMTLPVLPETGVIKPGKVLRYVDDNDVLRLGVVRATNIGQQFPVLTQSLEIDSHV